MKSFHWRFMMEKEGFVYIWFDRKHKRYYIGCHWGTLDDGYVCSSTWMLQGHKRRPNDFKRRILKRNILKVNLHEEEYKWLKLTKTEELGDRYYNLNNHHFGHWSTIETNSLSVKQKLSEASKRLHQDPVYKEKYLDGRKKMPKPTTEQIAKRAKSNTGKKRTEETKRRISESNMGKIMGPLSDEHRKKVSDALKGDKNPFFGKTHDPDLKKLMNEKTSQTMKGIIPSNLELLNKSFWWTDGLINRRCIDCPGEGWLRGKRNNKLKKEGLVNGD